MLIFAVLVTLAIAGSYIYERLALPATAAGLAFAQFGLVLVLPMETVADADEASLGIGAILAVLSALGSALCSLAVVAKGPAGAVEPAVGAGRANNPQFTGALAGAAAPQGAPQTPAGGGGQQPGWYPDPHGQAKLRYYDGREWTQQTSN